MRSKIAILYLVLFALGGSSLYAQGLKSYIRRANKLYQAKDYAGATQEYRRALLRDSLSGKANSVYQQLPTGRDAMTKLRTIWSVLPKIRVSRHVSRLVSCTPR